MLVESTSIYMDKFGPVKGRFVDISGVVGDEIDIDPRDLPDRVPTTLRYGSARRTGQFVLIPGINCGMPGVIR